MAPVIITIDQANINNMLIVSPPPQVREEESQSDNKTALDVNFLNQDFLEYNELDEDELKKFTRLDENLLDTELLFNLLDASTAQLAASQETLSMEASMLPNFNPAQMITYYIDAEDESKLVLNRTTSHVATVILNREHNAVLNISQDGVQATQQINRGGNTTITILQK
jgi:hypothetical protein